VYLYVTANEREGLHPSAVDLRKNLFITKSFGKSRNLFSKRFLAAGGVSFKIFSPPLDSPLRGGCILIMDFEFKIYYTILEVFT